MEIIINSDPTSAARLAGGQIARLLRDKPDAVLGLATGSTPLPLYHELVRLHREEGLDFSRVRTFNLDEYLGLAPDHPASYHRFMQENLFGHLNIPAKNIRIPKGTVVGGDLVEWCQGYEDDIRAVGGLDLQLLGIGTDGHIGFNEPTSSLASRTRIKTLSEQTRQDNARFFAPMDDVPYHVITMGIATIMDARSVLLMAWGSNKMKAVAGAVEGPVTAMNPASILQMHPHATVYLDEEAAGGLQRADYYRYVFAHKPAWQLL
ncbi:MAG: glucosamine-6-phosphate deaminase [Akkermansiaceae bacterium]